MDHDLDMLYNANRDRMVLENQQVPRRYILDMSNPLESYNDRAFKKRCPFYKDVLQNVLVSLVQEREPLTRIVACLSTQ